MLGTGLIIWRTLRPKMTWVPPASRDAVSRSFNGFPYSREYYRRIDLLTLANSQRKPALRYTVQPWRALCK